MRKRKNKQKGKGWFDSVERAVRKECQNGKGHRDRHQSGRGKKRKTRKQRDALLRLANSIKKGRKNQKGGRKRKQTGRGVSWHDSRLRKDILAIL